MSTVGPLRRDAGALVGRDDDLALVHTVLDEAGTRGSALLLSGQAGVGKTVLLDAATRSAAASGALLLRGGGVEFEATVSFSALNQLLLPLAADIGGLDAVRRCALRVALGLDDGPGATRSVVCSAALALLRGAAAARAVLLLVDDLHWVDRSSATVLSYLAHHVADSRIGFLGAFRSDVDSFFDPAGLPLHELRPLEGDAAARVLGTLFPALAPRVARRVLADAEGNPLALVELPSALTGPQRAAREPLPRVLPLSWRLQGLFASRVRGLPAATRRLLLLTALEGTGDLRPLRDVVGDPALCDLAPAEQAGLVVVDATADRLAFCHPLVRSTAVAASPGTERRAAHRAIASALRDDPDRRAWHLAEGSVAADEGVAGLLERTARRALRRGDPVGAVTALRRAAELSPRFSDESRRLAEAAYVDADVTGELRTASELLLDARRADPLGNGSLQTAVAASCVALNGEGDVDTAHRLLTGALHAATDQRTRDPALPEALQTLLSLCLWGQRPDLWRSFHTGCARVGLAQAPVLDLQARLLGDPARAPADALERLDAAIEGLEAETDVVRIERVARAGTFVDRVSGCRHVLERVVRNGRDGGAVAVALEALVHLCVDDFTAGRWDEAEQRAGEGLQLSTTHGYTLLSWQLRVTQALVAAVRGRFDTARSLADRMTRWVAPRGVGAVMIAAHHVRGLAALGRCDFDDAYRHAAAISPAGTFRPLVPHALWVPMDLVDAAVHTHRLHEAAAHVRAMRDLNLAASSPRLALLVAGSAAMAAPDARVVELFEDALALPHLDRWPFDVARVQLAYGERLRRARSTTSARVHLAAALEVFQRLDAHPWAIRAHDELRATGMTRPRADGSGLGALTPQERQVARLAASGRTNRQIADQLLLSPRTVGAHLRHVFPKLGVSSRAALGDALVPEPDDLRAGAHPTRVPS